MLMLRAGRGPSAILLMIVAAFALLQPARAQGVAWNLTDGAPVAADGASSITENGFTLVEHRPRSFFKAPPSGVARQGPALSPPQSQRLGRVPPSNFMSAARDRVIMYIRAAEVQYGLPAGLLDALVAAESGYRSAAVSKAGAAGLAQLMPGTARDLGVFDRFDIRANLDGGARYLRSMIEKFGSIPLALAAYNAGPAAVLRARGIPRNSETPIYVRRVLRQWRLLWP